MTLTTDAPDTAVARPDTEGAATGAAAGHARRVPDSASLLAERYAAAEPGSPKRARLREEVIVAWQPLAKHLANRYHGRGEQLDDLVQTATVGLIKAVDRFDAGRGVDFPGFAVPTILGEIRRHFRDRTWAVRVPRRLQELRIAIGRANTELTQTLGHSPTAAEVAEHLGIGEEEVLEGLECAQAYSTASLSAPVNDGSAVLSDTLGQDDHDMEMAEFRIALGPAWNTLGAREQTILRLRFAGELSQQEIAAKVGISQMHVSRLISRSLAQLREHLNAG